MINKVDKVKEGHPSISVALCTYNGEKYLRNQLDSILCQTYPADEIVITDDCSTDGTLEIIKEYAEKTAIIKYSVNERNLGYVQNFSRAISKTSCDFVALSDQDDIWTENHLELLLTHIEDNAICVADAMMVDEAGKELGIKFSEIKQNDYIPAGNIPKVYRIVYNYNPYQGASMLINRKWVEGFLPFPPGTSFHDTFLAGCACLTKGLAVIPDVINRYRMHKGQVSTTWKVTVFDEIRRKRHHICFPNKQVMIDFVLKTVPSLSPEATDFINEFKHILMLDHMGRKKRIEILRIMNRHYKEIHSCPTYKYIILRSLHFLLAF